MLGVGRCVVMVSGGWNQLRYVPSSELCYEQVIMPRSWVHSSEVICFFVIRYTVITVQRVHIRKVQYTRDKYLVRRCAL
jgi:hypothetical protein